MFSKKLFVKIVNVVVLMSFVFSNCVWAGGTFVGSYEKTTDKLAAHSQISGTLKIAEAIYTGNALHSALIGQDIKALKDLYLNQEKLIEKLREVIGERSSSLKTLIFADKADPKKIAYYTFTQDGYFYRFINAEEVNDPFYGLIKNFVKSSKLDKREVLISGGNYYQEILEVSPEIVNLVNTAINELYPGDIFPFNSELQKKIELLMLEREYYVIEQSTGRIVERMSVSGERVLRAKGLSEEDITNGIKESKYVVKSKLEILQELDRSKCGIGITGGGDCAGIADCLGTIKQNLSAELNMLGVPKAGQGLMAKSAEFQKKLIIIDDLAAEDFLGQASTPLGSSRENPFSSKKDPASVEKRENAIANIREYGFFYGTGGNDHLGLLERIAKQFPNMVVVGTFKSIDGDGWVAGKPAQMLGFHSAVDFYRREIYNIAQSAKSHGNIHVVEAFGRKAGKLAFEAARKYPPDFSRLSREERRKIIECRETIMILVPEKPVSLKEIAERAKQIKEKYGSCVIVVAEGFMSTDMIQIMKKIAANNDLKIRWLKNSLSEDKFLAAFSDMKNKGLISYDNPGEIVPLLVRDIQGVICDIDMSDESFDIASMPRNQELAVQFAKAVWETELDAHGNVTKLAGIRNFIIKALNILGGIERVNENLLNYEARGVSPDEYDRTMARKIGEKMAELINQGVKGGKAVIYFEDVDAMTEEPEVVDLVGVSDENNLNNEDMYPEELLIENGVFWDKAKELIDNQADEDLFLFEIESGKVILRSCIGGKRELINRDYERLSEEDIKRGVKEGRFYWVRESELVGGIQREKSGLIVTEGGDSAGIGDTISSLVFNLDDGYTAFGVRKAGKGLEVTPAHFNDSLVWYDDLVAEDLQGQSSTPTGASRTNPLVTAEENALVNIGGRRFFCATGGNGAMRMLVDIARRIPDILALGTLKSIDGDACINGRPVQMLGFNTAVKTYREAIYAAAQNARTHGEMHVIEVFGRDAGRLAFEAARWYPKDFNKLSTEERRKIIECRDRIVILVPERPVSLMEIAKKAKEIKDKKGNCVVVVAEGFRPPELKEEVERLSQDNNLKIRWLKSNQSDEQFAESFRLMKDKGLIEYQSANDVIPLCVGEIRDLIEVSGDTDPRSALKAILFDKELAAQFAKMVWEIETDKYGTVTKMSGIRKFIIQALIRLGGAKKVNEMLKTYEARGASPSEYDSVMGRKIGKKWAELINEGTTGVKAVVYFEGMDAMTEDPFVVDIETVSAENNLNQTYYSDELLQENGVFWVKENKPQEGLAHGSHLVKRVDGSLAENEIYSARVNENGVLIGGNKPRDKKDEIEGYMTALQQTLERLAHIYGPGIFTKIENVRIVENLNSENLYPQGRSPLASYKDGVLKIDVLSFKHGPWILFEELEHEFIESIAGLVPGSNEIISDIIATYRNAMRFLKPNEGVNDTALKYDVAVYQEGILSVVRAPGNPIDPDGEYLNLLTYLNNLQKLNEVTENEVILAVVRYVMRTKLYEKAREQLNLPDEVAKKIREFHLKVGDAMSVFGEIAKAKQPVDLTDRIKGTNNITVTVTKTFTGLRVNGLDSISAKLAEIVGALVKQITSTDKLSGALTKMDTAKYILGDKERLEELKKAMGERDYEAIAANLKRNNFELVTELPESVDLGHVIRLVDPGDLEKMPNIDRMYYLPMPYTRSALYMAANIIQAEGDLNKIPLVKELIEDLYKGLDEADIIALITRPWTILPKIKPVIEEINNIRKAIVEIEKAA